MTRGGGWFSDALLIPFYPHLVLEAQVLQDLGQLCLGALGRFGSKCYYEFNTNLKALARAQFREEFHSQAIPHLGRDIAVDAKLGALWLGRGFLWP